MSYLNKEQRREIILQAAECVALSEGLQAMTVRRIAGEAGIATGQVHHHFASSSALKAEVFLRISDQALARHNVAENTAENANWRERLHDALGSQESAVDPYLALWREAQLEAGRDPVMREAYIQSMAMWHQRVVAVIHQGIAAGGFTTRQTPESIAWRLISLSCGMDGLYVLGVGGIDDATFYQHLEQVITLELG
ncbi:TetR family transcriptional regulator [Shimwellia pseudoproteus]|uniref:TetR family transcriptional regulator n=1 Tax=Shimwellia pseudoproteus TaxID=570012 RepID=UPI0018ED7F62|nr:TetR family transcriptional regulator [Shimwellia pseudoproteus]MBJ3814258.1 TetR family transcriptional regulator [Shimwellia pseudoproteus]